MGSSRLPGKVLMPLLGKPMLWHIVHRVRATPSISDVVVATSVESKDEPLRAYCESAGIPFFAGSETDVLDRFYNAAVQFKADPVIRITADCPFADPEIIERVITMYRTGNYDHVGVVTGAGAAFETRGRFPDGLDAECFGFATLERAWREATAKEDREHVTPYIWRVPGRFRLGGIRPEKDYSTLRWTVDTAEDMRVAERMYSALYSETEIFGIHDMLYYLTRHPEVTVINQSAISYEGYGALWRVTETNEQRLQSPEESQ